MRNEYTASLPTADFRNGSWRRNGINYKITHAVAQLLGIGETQPFELVKVVYNEAKSADGMSPIYCTIWAHGPHGSPYASGSGSASGMGYHKESAALEAAVRNAGIEIVDSEGRQVYFGGMGEAVAADVIRAIASAVGNVPPEYIRILNP